MIMAVNLSVSASGMQTQSWRIDALANDIANVNTTGFKAQLPVSSTTTPGLAYPAGLAVGPGVPPDVLAGGGAAPLAILQDMAEGAASPTGRPLDLYIAGNGLFAVQAPGGGGPVYTRDGRFSLNGAGTLVDGAGRALLDVNGQPIRLPQGVTGIEVSPQGEVSAVLGGARTQIGQIGLTLVAEPQGLQGWGTGVWVATPATGKLTVLPPGKGQAGTLRSGMLEASNASLATLLPDLLAAQQSYALNARALDVSLQMWSLDNQL
jgi:flagellar basal-body rod protein FlgG